jgi:hypothetical protein
MNVELTRGREVEPPDAKKLVQTDGYGRSAGLTVNHFRGNSPACNNFTSSIRKASSSLPLERKQKYSAGTTVFREIKGLQNGGRGSDSLQR